MSKVTLIERCCKSCNIIKPIGDYYPQTSRTAWWTICKKCHGEKQKARRLNDPIFAEACRERLRNPEHRLRTKLWYQKNKDKVKASKSKASVFLEQYNAHLAVFKAFPVVKGYHRHHWSYNDEHFLDVILVPKERHAFVHGKMLYVRDKKMYAIKESNELLDSREKHEAFIMRFY